MSARAGLRRDVALVAWQVLYEQRSFWRNRTRAFFSFLFPLVFLVIFASLNSGHQLPGAPAVAYDTFFVPGMLAYGVITTTFVNMALSTAYLRDEGVLKRMQGTPLPAWCYLAGRVGSTIVVVAAICLCTVLLGVLAYGVRVRAATLPGLALALVVGAACFTALGIGIVRFIPNADSAPPIVNIATLPLTFISGVWFVTTGLPGWLRDIAAVFPIHALAHALQLAFDPRTAGAGISGADLRVLGIWLLAGAVLTARLLRRPEPGRS